MKFNNVISLMQVINNVEEKILKEFDGKTDNFQMFYTQLDRKANEIQNEVTLYFRQQLVTFSRIHT